MEKKSNSRLSPEFVLLGFLYQKPSHGYELNKRLQEEFGHIWRVSQSQTYNILKRLESQGLITATAVEQPKLPSRQQLQLSAAGTRRFMRWLNAPTPSSVHAIRVEFITRLYFIRQYYPQKVDETIQAQIAQVNAGIERLERVRASLSGDQTFNRLALDLRLKLLLSIVAWLNECGKSFMQVSA